MVGFDDLYRQGGAVTWQAGKEDVVRQAVELLTEDTLRALVITSQADGASTL